MAVLLVRSVAQVLSQEAPCFSGRRDRNIYISVIGTQPAGRLCPSYPAQSAFRHARGALGVKHFLKERSERLLPAAAPEPFAAATRRLRGLLEKVDE